MYFGKSWHFSLSQLSTHRVPFPKAISTQLSVASNKSIAVTIVDMMGAKIYNDSYDVHAGTNNLPVMLSALPKPGVYVITGEIDGRRYFSRLLVE